MKPHIAGTEEAIERAQHEWGAKAWVDWRPRAAKPFVIGSEDIDGNTVTKGAGTSWEVAFAVAEIAAEKWRIGMRTFDCDLRNAASLKKMAQLYRKIGREKEAEAIEKRVTAIRARKWLSAAPDGRPSTEMRGKRCGPSRDCGRKGLHGPGRRGKHGF